MRRSDGEVVLEWPLLNHIITAGWTYNNGSAHRALDFRAVVGTPVYASESGMVDQVQYWNGKSKTGMQSYGNMVRIRHSPYKGKNLQTRYAHLKTILVKNGQTVNEGDLIGYSGETGNCFGEHLHYEVLYNGVRVNPLNWLDKISQLPTQAWQNTLGLIRVWNVRKRAPLLAAIILRFTQPAPIWKSCWSCAILSS